MCQVCLKFAQWFWRKQNFKSHWSNFTLTSPWESNYTAFYLMFVAIDSEKKKVLSTCTYHHYLPSGKGMTLIKMLVWNLPWSSEDFVKLRKLDLWKTTHKGSVPARSGEKIQNLKFCIIVENWPQNVLTTNVHI